ncbi:hypothetical protein B0H10DRAFT_1956041 [Mycena sp. CBHHK59/15]|nr:hypothetical protein B0H10DRAFT_1956041 [Mycena sp. CBHHK59/15]
MSAAGLVSLVLKFVVHQVIHLLTTTAWVLAGMATAPTCFPFVTGSSSSAGTLHLPLSSDTAPMLCSGVDRPCMAPPVLSGSQGRGVVCEGCPLEIQGIWGTYYKQMFTISAAEDISDDSIFNENWY